MQFLLRQVNRLSAQFGNILLPNFEVIRVVFRDSGFKDDVAKTNAAQILKQAGIDDVKSL